MECYDRSAFSHARHDKASADSCCSFFARWTYVGYCADLVAESVEYLAGHSSQVRGVEFSPDGTLILSACAIGPARIWSVVGGTCLRMLAGHNNGVREASFSRDGNCVLTVAALGCTAKMWNTGSGRCEKIPPAHPSGERGGEADVVQCTAVFSPEGGLALTTCTLRSLEATVKIWNACLGTCMRVFNFNGLHSCSCNVSFDGSSLIVVPKADLEIWILGTFCWASFLRMSLEIQRKT